MNDNKSKLEILKDLSEIQKRKFFDKISKKEALTLLHDITFIGRPKQQLPSGEWDTLLVLAGRGFGA